jgi:hypothetical protein
LLCFSFFLFFKPYDFLCLVIFIFFFKTWCIALFLYFGNW